MCSNFRKHFAIVIDTMAIVDGCSENTRAVIMYSKQQDFMATGQASVLIAREMMHRRSTDMHSRAKTRTVEDRR